MLNKKNIAMAMAAATTMTAAAPMASVVFADVVNNTQAEEIKALKEQVYELLNTRYTTNHNLLIETDLAGEKVFESVQILVDDVAIEDGVAGIYTNYAAFEKAFDQAFGKMINGQVIKVKYESSNGYKKLEDGQIVDATYESYKLEDDMDVDAIIEAVMGDVTEDYLLKLVGKKVSAGVQADEKSYAKIPVTDGYITVKDDDDKLDLSKPKFKVVDGYYVDAKGNNIKKFIQSEELVDQESGNFIEELIAVGGVVEGYYPVKTETKASDKADTIAIVKKSDAAVKEDLTVGDLYEASTDRLTVKGNEIVSLLQRILEDEENEPEDQLDNLRTKVVAMDKAGEVIDTLVAGDEIDGVDTLTVTDLEELLSNEDVKTVKLIVETTKDENAQRPEWSVAYEATITEARNEDFVNIARGFAGIEADGLTAEKLEMPTLAGMNRYATAAEVSRQFASDEVDHIVLVSGASDKLVDGLTATPLAAMLNEENGAPILLTKQNELPEETIREIKRLNPTHVTIVGGTSAVSEELANKLTKTYGLKVNRLSGDSRYETSLAVANEMASIATDSGQESALFDQVFVVGGKGEADALSASAVAGATKSPILLTPANELDKDVKYFINKNVADTNNEADVFVVGGTNSVSNAVQRELVNINVINQASNKVEVKRLAGEGRQETNAAVIAEFAGHDDMTKNIVVAKSDNKGMIDALAAGAYAASTGSHIVLATNELTEAQEDALAKVKVEKDEEISEKVQVGYNVGKSVVQFVNKLFTRN